MNDTPQTLEKDVRDNLLLLYDFDKDYDVKLLKYSENVIFKITFKEAFPVVLRIHRPGYHNIEELEGEILWMDEIHRDTDVELPVVYRGRDGRFLQKMTTFSGEEVYVSVISFLEGSPLGELKDDELIKGLESLIITPRAPYSIVIVAKKIVDIPVKSLNNNALISVN